MSSFGVGEVSFAIEQGGNTTVVGNGEVVSFEVSHTGYSGQTYQDLSDSSRQEVTLVCHTDELESYANSDITNTYKTFSMAEERENILVLNNLDKIPEEGEHIEIKDVDYIIGEIDWDNKIMELVKYWQGEFVKTVTEFELEDVVP